MALAVKKGIKQRFTIIIPTWWHRRTTREGTKESRAYKGTGCCSINYTGEFRVRKQQDVKCWTTIPYDPRIAPYAANP